MDLDVQTVPDLLILRAERDGERQAIVTPDATVTFGELDRVTANLARRLAAVGVARGAQVGLLAPNGIEWAEIALAVMRLGATLVPLSTLLRPPELLAQLTTASVTHLITVPEFRSRRYIDELEQAAPGLVRDIRDGRTDALVPSLRALWLSDDLPEAMVTEDLVRSLGDRVSPTDDMAILFTSGSRGTPKGVIHTHGAALRAVASGLEARCVRRDTRLYIPMPFFWTGGFGQGLLTAVIAGATLVTEAEPSPAATLALLQREHVTLFRGWPDQAARLAASPEFASTDLSSLDDASLSAVLPPDRRPAPGARANLFGMTETFGPYCGAPLDRDLPLEKWGSCGRPFEGVIVRIVDPESGESTPAGVVGEIWIGGDQLLRGICGRRPKTVFTRDGLYRTGDLGHVDEDGYLWFSGRLDDMVKIKGATVYPSEVEAALRAIDGVRQAHVTDIGDEQGGRCVAAFVVTDMPLEAVRHGVRERVSAFKIPSRWVIASGADAVPVLPSGKVDKNALQKLLETEGSTQT